MRSILAPLALATAFLAIPSVAATDLGGTAGSTADVVFMDLCVSYQDDAVVCIPYGSAPLCTPMTVAAACVDTDLPPDSHVCAAAGINPADGRGSVQACAAVAVPTAPPGLAPSHVCVVESLPESGQSLGYCPVTVFRYGQTCVVIDYLAGKNTSCF